MQEQSQNDFVDGEDDTVFVYEGNEVYVEQITVTNFNSKLDNGKTQSPHRSSMNCIEIRFRR